ncbi:sortase [Candidatus Woesebacteria bacterium]|nr:sortase [Candidatus Woesebacteria bacterium]QQG47938.1 MAG: sortase [Candidatus Woesebacteria bacterium]
MRRAKILLPAFFLILAATLLCIKFKTEKIEAAPSVSDQVIVSNEKYEPDHIRIKDLNINIAVQKAKIIRGYWEVFDDRAGWGEGSSLPGSIGNAVIFAHKRAGLFINLGELSPDMLIEIHSGPNIYSYKMVKKYEVSPSDTSVVKPTQDETLTLFTCAGPFDTKRLVVVAKRV